MALEKDGKCKGFAFVEFEEEVKELYFKRVMMLIRLPTPRKTRWQHWRRTIMN